MGPTTSTEFSAGGVVVRDGQCVVIVPTRLAANGTKVLALPKGHPEEGESPSEAALREVREEAGVVARLVEPLGDVRYWYTRNGRRIAKVVSSCWPTSASRSTTTTSRSSRPAGWRWRTRRAS